MKLLVDTSIIIEFLRLRDKLQTTFYGLLAAEHELLVSVLTHTELYAGRSVWEKAQARQELESLFEGLTLLPLTEELSVKAGQIKAKNHDVSLIDSIIAATAIQHNLPLVTLNTKDFVRIKEVNLFKL